MRAVLIDPFACTVEDVDAAISPGEDGNLDAIYAVLSHETQPVTTFQIIHLDGDDLYIDEHGGIRPCARFFTVGSYPRPLAGKGLILGHDAFGDSAPATLHLAAVRAATNFVEVSDPGRTGIGVLLPTNQPWRAGAPQIQLIH